jgi:hypothetical protein
MGGLFADLFILVFFLRRCCIEDAFDTRETQGPKARKGSCSGLVLASILNRKEHLMQHALSLVCGWQMANGNGIGHASKQSSTIQRFETLVHRLRGRTVFDRTTASAFSLGEGVHREGANPLHH